MINEESSIEQPIEQPDMAPATTSPRRRHTPDYMRRYYQQRKTEEPLYYKLQTSRTYFRRKLKHCQDETSRLNIQNRIAELDNQLKSMKEARPRYCRLAAAPVLGKGACD